MNTIVRIACFSLYEIFRKKDFYVLLLLLIVLMLYMGQAGAVGVADAYRYLKELGAALVFLFSLVIAIPFAAKALIAEVAAKTIYPLAAKPISRAQIVIGKYAGSVFVSWSVFSLFYAAFFFMCLLREPQAPLLLYAQTYYAGLIMFAMLNAMVLCISVAATFSTTVTLSFLIYFLMSWFGSAMHERLESLSWLGTIVYHGLPHFEFFDLRHRLVHGWTPLPGAVLAALTLYGIVYGALLVGCAVHRFGKKWL